MDCNWHKLYFPCPKCTNEMAVMEICTSADGEIMVGLACANCGDTYTWRKFFTKLINDNLMRDLQPKSGKPVKPPLRLPAPDTTEQDRKFLKDLGIGDPDETPPTP